MALREIATADNKDEFNQERTPQLVAKIHISKHFNELVGMYFLLLGSGDFSPFTRYFYHVLNFYVIRKARTNSR